MLAAAADATATPAPGRSLGSRTAAYAALSLQRARVGRLRYAKVFGPRHAFRFAMLGALSGTKDGVMVANPARISSLALFDFGSGK